MKELHLRTTPFLANWDQLRDHIEQFCYELQLNSRNRYTILLCCEEWFVNIVTHGYVDADLSKLQREELEVMLELHDQTSLTITFCDHGHAYNPLLQPLPQLEGNAENRQFGGLGIFFIRSKMDSCEYEYRNNTNIFIMKKDISENEDDNGCKS